MSTTLLSTFLLALRVPLIGASDTPDLSKRVVRAVNCGGGRHLGAYGILYEEDQNSFGLPSDHGSRYFFPNAQPSDRRLYETERYGTGGDLVYTFDIKTEGAYVIILKFSEVYFQSSGMKVFNVYVNNILAKERLDIFRETGAAGLAHDIYIDLLIKNKEVTIGDSVGKLDHELKIRFTPLIDNPKINAIAVLTGTSESLPPPPKPPVLASKRRRSQQQGDDVAYDEDFVYDSDFYHDVGHSSMHEVASGPPATNPFDTKKDDVFMYLSVALVCLLPVVAFLMRM